MFFGNPQLLERHLHNDLNTFIKNIKAREDQHITLLQYNKGVINQLLQMDSIPFLQEEIAKHKSFYSSIQASHESIQIQQKQLVEKYACTISGDPSILKLMSRVIARVFEIFQASLDKAKFLDETLFVKHQEIKSTMLRSINQEKIQIQSLLETIICYVQKKNCDEIKKLNQIIKILIEGDIQKLKTVYKPPEAKLEVKRPPLPEKSEAKKSLQKQKNKQKLQKIKEQTQKAEKAKKQKTKLVSKMVTSLYSTMEISKQQLNEDMIFRHPEEQRRRLYDEIMSRNKLNHEQILGFESKRENFEKKVKQFKEMMQRESQKIQEALVFVTPIRKKQKEPSDSPISPNEPKVQGEEICEIVMPDNDKMFRKRQHNKAPSPRINKQGACASMQSTQQGFQHIKFDTVNQEIFPRSNRAKLPQISGRSSLDNRYENLKGVKGGSEHKDIQRVNIAKNVQIGSFNGQTAKNSSVAYEINRRSPRQKSPVAIMYEGSPNGGLNQMIGGFDFTFYARKKGQNKFNETRNNFIL